MKYLAAYMLLNLGGKKDVTEKDLADFFNKINCEVDQENMKNVVEALKGKDLAELASQGLPKLASLSFGSGNSSAAAPAETTAAVASKPVEEEKKEEPVEEAADFDLGDMFG